MENELGEYEFKTNNEKVLEIFFDDPTRKFYIREIARTTNLNPNTVLNITNKLLKKGLIKREKKSHVVELYANLNKEFKTLKRVNNLKRIYESGIVEFLAEKFSPEAIVLIGSYSSGEDIKKSDIDIVVLPGKKDETIESLDEFEKNLARKIHLINVNYNAMSDEFYTNLINGVILEGFLRKK